MTETRRAAEVRGVLGGVVIALATLIAIFAFWALARAQTPSTNMNGATPVNNGAENVIGASSTMPAAPADGATIGTSTSATSTPAGPASLSANGAGAPLLAAAPPAAPAPMVLTVGNDGHVLIRGVVTAAAARSLTIASWGGNWTVNIMADTDVIPAGALDIRVGDFVGADGVIGAQSGFTVNASVVRDWTTAPAVVSPATSARSPNAATSTPSAGAPASGSTSTNTPSTTSTTRPVESPAY